MAPEEFHRHTRWLASGRVRVVRLEELLRLPDSADAVALTFDDGFANFVEEAIPRLREYSLPVTLFVVAGHVGGDNAWGGRPDPRVPTLPLLDWSTLGRLAGQGVRLGAHTRTHPHLTAVPGAQLEDELAGAKEDIRRETGQRPEEFAYPYGDVNPEVARAAGVVYARACTTELRPLRPGELPELLPRLDMFYLREAGQLEAWGTGRFHRHLWVRAQARRIRQRLSAVGAGW